MSQTIVNGYWWTSRPNFGDLLTPLLLDHFSNLEVHWSGLAQADLICVGSVLDALPDDWPGLVIGSGKLYEHRPINLSRATLLAVRGPLSAQGLRGYPVLGDPGLLANDLVQVKKEYALGLVPHWSDTELERRPEFLKYNPKIIRVSDDPLDVIAQIGSCEKIVASSLHGIIVADSFCIPRRIEMAQRFEQEGGDFKFRDYNAALGVEHQIGKTQQVQRSIVQDKQSELYDVLLEVGRILG